MAAEIVSPSFAVFLFSFLSFVYFFREFLRSLRGGGR